MPGPILLDAKATVEEVTAAEGRGKEHAQGVLSPEELTRRVLAQDQISAGLAGKIAAMEMKLASLGITDGGRGVVVEEATLDKPTSAWDVPARGSGEKGLPPDQKSAAMERQRRMNAILEEGKGGVATMELDVEPEISSEFLQVDDEGDRLDSFVAEVLKDQGGGTHFVPTKPNVPKQ